jgi:polyhydroxyalkanoate synthesis regulator phasin
MNELIKKTLLTGLGLAFLTKEKIEEVTKEFIDKGKLSEQEGKKLYDELLEKAEESKEDVKKQIESITKESMKKMNLASRDELQDMEKRLQELIDSQNSASTADK